MEFWVIDIQSIGRRTMSRPYQNLLSRITYSIHRGLINYHLALMLGGNSHVLKVLWNSNRIRDVHISWRRLLCKAGTIIEKVFFWRPCIWYHFPKECRASLPDLVRQKKPSGLGNTKVTKVTWSCTFKGDNQPPEFTWAYKVPLHLTQQQCCVTWYVQYGPCCYILDQLWI